MQLAMCAGSVSGQNHVTCDEEAHGTAEKDISGKMSACSDARETDGPCQTIGEERNLAMLAVSLGQNGSNSGRSHGMFGKKPPELNGLCDPLKKLPV
jgi:hypothetical protein